MRDRDVQLLRDRLLVYPRFRAVPQLCRNNGEPGVDEVPDWQIWARRETTLDQLRIEEQLDKMVNRSTSILHIGAGNSSLGLRFAQRGCSVLATTIHEEELQDIKKLTIENYSVVIANKFAVDMDEINGQFDLIVDNNPSSFACCLFHFARMMVKFFDLLKNGGQILTAQPGLGWVVSNNNPNWSLGWDDWVNLGAALGMPSRKLSEFVYSIERLPESGLVRTV